MVKRMIASRRHIDRILIIRFSLSRSLPLSLVRALDLFS